MTKSQHTFTDAVKMGLVHLVAQYVQEGESVHDVQPGGLTLLMVAARHGHLHLVQYLTRICGLDIDAMDNAGSTALSLAAANGHLEVVRHLMSECEAIVVSPALNAASAAGHVEVVRYLAKETHVHPNVLTQSLDKNASNAFNGAVQHNSREKGRSTVKQIGISSFGHM